VILKTLKLGEPMLYVFAAVETALAGLTQLALKKVSLL
jgi:hypothetical protein